MAVLLPDGTYEARRHVDVLDRHRQPVASWPDAADWTGSGMRKLNPDRSFDVYLDPSAWPLAYDDELTCPDGVQLLVRTAIRSPASAMPELEEVAHVLATCEPRHKPRLPSGVG